MEDELKKKLLKKFFYIHWRNDTNVDDNNTHTNTNNNYNNLFKRDKSSIDNFKDINKLNIEINNNKRKLSALKIKSLRSMIINQKQIPQKWIIHENYKIILDKAIKAPNFVDYAKNYIEHKSINKKKEDLRILKAIKESKIPKFLTIVGKNRPKIINGKGNSTELRNKYGYKLNHKLKGNILNKVFSYRGINTESPSFNSARSNSRNERNILAEYSNMKKSYDNNFKKEDFFIIDKSLKKNLRSNDNIYLGNKLALPKII